METLTRRRMRVALMTVGLAGLLAAVNAVPGAATPPSGLTNVTLARGTDLSVGTIAFQEGTDVVVTQITVIPGGSSGWHAHPGGAIVVVKQGELTVHRSIGSQCETTNYTAGQAFIEAPGQVADRVNTRTHPAVLFVPFPRVPQAPPAAL